MKLAILGGGGFRTPWVYQALAGDTSEPGVDDVVLFDIDRQRLEVVAAVLAQVVSVRSPRPVVRVTTELDEAVEGADFVFAAIREGGLAGRQADEHVALDLGVLGQETTGPGGLAYGLRTIPVMQRIARRIRALAPEAWVMNFTNPAGMITEAMQAILGDRVLGICDTPSGLGRRVAEALDLPPAELQLDYIGLNHLGWMRRIFHEGTDVLPELLSDPERTGALEEGSIFGAEWLTSMGVIPNEYLYYYYLATDAIAAIRAAPETRGDFLARTQPAFYAAVAADPSTALQLWRATVAGRSATYMAEARGGVQAAAGGDDGYAGVALAVMRSISRNERNIMILNVRNGTTVAALPADAVIEVPTMVDGNGVHPLATTAPEPYQLGLMASVKAVERLVISAATNGSVADARNAFALHPLVGSVTTAQALLAGYRAAIPGVDRLFHTRR